MNVIVKRSKFLQDCSFILNTHAGVLSQNLPGELSKIMENLCQGGRWPGKIRNVRALSMCSLRCVEFY